jgi:membrane protease YdiL (CAAX protease family)
MNASTSEFLMQGAATTPQRVLFVLLVVIAGTVEELLYRAFAIPTLMWLGATRAVSVLMSSLAFGAFHTSDGVALGAAAAVAGSLLGWLFLRIRNVWPCVLLHATFIAVVVATTPAPS